MSDLVERARNNANHNCQLPAEDTRKLLDEIERLNGLVALQKKDMKGAMDRIAKLEDVREHAGRSLRDPNWDTHRKNLIKAITDSYVQANSEVENNE